MTTQKARIGFISANNRWGSHYDEFLKLVPAGVEVQIEGLGLYTAQITELEGKAEVHARKTAELAAANDWKGIAVMGAPMEVQNPGLPRRIREMVSVPVTTAMEAGAAALRALGTRRALLLTPFDNAMKARLQAHLKTEGIDALLPADAFSAIDRAAEQTPEQVYALAKNALAKAPNAQAIYFQGAPLDPLQVVERIESDLGVPVVASNPTMLWYICTKVGLKFSVRGGGRMLREWPAPVPV